MTMKQARRRHRSLFTMPVMDEKGNAKREKRANYVSFRTWARGAFIKGSSPKLASITGYLEAA